MHLNFFDFLKIDFSSILSSVRALGEVLTQGTPKILQKLKESENYFRVKSITEIMYGIWKDKNLECDGNGTYYAPL